MCSHSLESTCTLVQISVFNMPQSYHAALGVALYSMAKIQKNYKSNWCGLTVNLHTLSQSLNLISIFITIHSNNSTSLQK